MIIPVSLYRSAKLTLFKLWYGKGERKGKEVYALSLYRNIGCCTALQPTGQQVREPVYKIDSPTHACHIEEGKILK